MPKPMKLRRVIEKMVGAERRWRGRRAKDGIAVVEAVVRLVRGGEGLRGMPEGPSWRRGRDANVSRKPSLSPRAMVERNQCPGEFAKRWLWFSLPVVGARRRNKRW